MWELLFGVMLVAALIYLGVHALVPNETAAAIIAGVLTILVIAAGIKESADGKKRR